MKLLLTAALLFTASAGIAFAEGRYETTSTENMSGVYITDTKTGSVRYCRVSGAIENMKMNCTPVKKADD